MSKHKSGQQLITYSCPAAELVSQKGGNQAAIELTCFYHSWPESSGGLGRFGHLRNAIDLIFNQKGQFFIWNEWSELIMRHFCEWREVSLAGSGATWKTTCMAVYALVCWMSSPLNTRFVITSTTLDGLRARIWKEVMHFYRVAGQPFGNPVNHPHPKIQSVKGDDGAGIFGIAVEAGDVDKAVENIKGRHAPNTFVEVDEATGVSAAIFDAGANLEKGTLRFQMIASANPVDQFDQHGLFSEPKDGWRSVSVETDKWITKRGGICLHLDGLKSPNAIAGTKKYPGMISLEDIEISRQRDGENSPKFWSQVRGFWPPEGLSTTVLTSTLIDKFKAREQPTWVGDTPKLGAALDPAFSVGGDRCVLRFAKSGRIDDQGSIRTVLCFTDTIVLKLDITTKEPIHYQIVRMVREECKARGISPDMFAMDASGEGGTESLFKREWSPDLIGVKFGGAASERRVSEVNTNTGREEYANRVTELWYQFRNAVERNQIRGLDVETAREFCERNILPMRGSRQIIESKVEMKSRIGHSPDLADAAVIMLELFLVRGLLPTISEPVLGEEKRLSWKDIARKIMPEAVYANP